MGSMGGLRIIENTIISIHFSRFVPWDGGHGRAQNHWKYNSIHAFFIICSVGWGAWAGSELLKIQYIHPFFMIWSVGWGAWAGSGSLKIQSYPCIFHDLFGRMGSMGRLRTIENTMVSMHFSLFVLWDGEHGRAQAIIENTTVSMHFWWFVRAGSESLECIFGDLFGGMGSTGRLRIIENTIVSMHFPWFVRWHGEHGQAQNR